MSDQIKIKKALLSVTDKDGLLPLAQTLISFGCELISTGGTAKYLSENSIKYTEISKVSGNPEAFGGRMKTISFNVESAILFNRIKDKEEASALGIEPIDMVICNFYDFKSAMKKEIDLSNLIEKIDIGGPTMIRAAAKNYEFVAAVTDVTDYSSLIAELNSSEGALSITTRKKLMAKAFNLTADYDSMIAERLDALNNTQSLRLSFKDGMEMRYGENSHQSALFYRLDSSEPSLSDIKIMNGIALSYNNVLDLQAALETISGLWKQSCVIVKHNNPCGMCVSDNQRKAFELAWAGDPVSAFGGIVAFNTPVSIDTVKFLEFDASDKSKKKFIEIIAAPLFDDDALEYLKIQKNLRIIRFDDSMLKSKTEIKISNNSALVQSKDDELYSSIQVVTSNSPFIDKDTISFGLIAVRHIKSNAIALVQKIDAETFQLIGSGGGQPNRLESIEIAIKKARKNLNKEFFHNDNLILISDAFFPFEDNVDLAHRYGIKILVEPGGSIRDKFVIKRAEEFGMTVVFTGNRHFKH